MADSFTVNDRVYGQWEVHDPLALSLIALPAFQRLYQVGQYGSYWFGLPHANTNRAEHSLGVYYLLKYFGASGEEQIAGLLHDISHAVFSHVIDYVYDDVQAQSSQDRAHASIIRQPGIQHMLSAAGFDHTRIADLEAFPMLDRDLPDLCIDRLEYFLRDSVCYGEMTPQEALGILLHISYAGGMFMLDDPDIARFVCLHSLRMNEQYWGPPFGCFMFERTSDAIKRALYLGVISEADFYGTDREVWERMRASGDYEILSALSDVEHIQELKLCLDPENYDYHLTSKF
ncbi:MAG: HD domain-containing protein, partial [Parcubacteria group bacterium]|nr:HD domain-containing protein [Parcubacteria group bacterium]